MTTSHPVAVQKDITLATGESLQAYSQKVRDAGTKYVKQKLNLQPKDCSCYPIEIFSKSVIFDVYQYGPNTDETNRCKYYAVAYSRKDNGSFEFSTLTEVERVVGYQVKDSAVPTTKALWSTAMINNLPDAAFAVILPGGKKDSEGKTTPRSLRMLPHHSAGVKSASENGSVDLPHLRNALARLDQSNMPSAQKATARAHLMAHAKELLPSQGGGGDKPTKKALEAAPGWQLTEKSLWQGVL